MTAPNATPTPGSPEALALGCRCPAEDNGWGKGAQGGTLGADGRPQFWYTSDCPVHAPAGAGGTDA